VGRGSAERARQQLLAKIDLGLWQPGQAPGGIDFEREPTFAELATDWLVDRERNPAIRPRTTENDRWRLTRYLVPFFGEMLPSQITALTLKQYRRRLHEDNEHVRASRRAGAPVRDTRRGQTLRTLSNDSINKTLNTLAAILDEAEDAGWIARNVARGRRPREPVARQRRDALEPEEFLSLLEACLPTRQPTTQTADVGPSARGTRAEGSRHALDRHRRPAPGGPDDRDLPLQLPRR
jgi:hypothetical protein